MNYRREIDGLRALAVVPVLLFHAGFQTFSGGFVGVDIFFVISGYLITSIILLEKEAGTFTLANFYERRARRILPALFVVMLTCLPLAWLWLLPRDMAGFAQSLIAVPIFASNILFWRTSGYFDVATDLKPLLHTWSLAVEEQYYLFFPIFLMLTWRLGRRWILWALAIAAVISLAAAQWGSSARPEAGFYLLPTRGWELLIGAFAAFALSTSHRLHANKALSETASWVGLALILFAIFVFDKRTPFPSLYTLAPTIGAVLIVLFATDKTAVGKLLGNKLFVGIGLISYSTYLWHQPLFALARHAQLQAPSKSLLAGLAIIAMILAYFTWKYVETPFRNKQRFDRKRIFLWGAIGSACFVAVGAGGVLLKGIPERFSADQRALLDFGDKDYKQTLAVYGLGKCLIDYDQTHEILLKNNCVSTDPRSARAIVFGDSEAAHWMSGVRQEFVAKGFSIGQWTGTSCRPVQYAKNNKRCADFYDGFLTNVLPHLSHSDVIIVSSRWIGLLQDAGADGFSRSIERLFEATRASNVRVIVIGATPEFYRAPNLLMVEEGIQNIGTVSLKSVDFREANSLLKAKAAQHGYIFLNPADVLCISTDPLRCTVADTGVFYFSDNDHLSTHGSTFLMSRLVKNKV
ncbi:MAG: Lipopolysaccharide modification acyltransferase [Rhodocyclales bacterium]|nr:Lipopolysaccharide modification acyltransferase [Rhodocyclales bacterium]